MKNDRFYILILSVVLGLFLTGISPVSACDAGEGAGKEALAPKYEGSVDLEATAGEDVRFVLTAGGDKPMIFSAESLPSELVLDMKTGIITGKVHKAGTYDINVTISNEHGKKDVTLKLKVKA